MNMKYRWILIGVMFAGCWIAYTYTPHSAIVQDGVQVIEEVKAITRIPDQRADILEIQASLTRIEGLLAEHAASNELRFASIEKELERRRP
jgi:hypothetical protein